MISFQLASDREVQIMGIGVLKPNVPMQLDEEALSFFKAVQGVSVPEAKFPAFVSVTAVIAEDEDGGA